MRKLTDEQLDELLGEHFGRELASQEGRSLGYFLKSTQPRHGGWARLVGWSAGIAAGAAAACIAIVVTQGRLSEWFGGKTGGQATSQPAPTIAPSVAVSLSTPVRREQIVQWDTLDEGAELGVDGQPVRQLRRVELERVRLLDVHGKVVFETVIPRERIMYIDARTY